MTKGIMEGYTDIGAVTPEAMEISKKSRRLISQMILGSAKLQLATGTHPGVLKDNVCSPAGTTICGVTALEENGFRNACIQSVDAIMNK